MDTHLAYLSEKILDVLSQSEDRYLLVAYPAENLCHWTENSVACFDIYDKDTRFDYLWTNMLHPYDRDVFGRGYQELIEGRTKRLKGEYRIRRRTGSYQYYICDIWRVSLDMPGSPFYLAGVITDPDGAQMVDPVTDLPSNFDFRRTLANHIDQQIECKVMMVGIDNFKTFNELYTYTFGNRILCRCADIIRGLLPPRCSLFRSEGDGFFIIFVHKEIPEIQEWFQKVLQTMRQPKEIDGINVSFTVSAGLCGYPENGGEAEELYHNVAITLKAAKTEGKSRLACYSKELSARVGIQTKLLSCLSESIALGFQGFSMYYQPLVHAQTGELAGCEALLRWEHPDFPDIPIQTCVACLEENGLIYEMGEWILDTSIRQCAEWLQYIPDFCMNINIACQQFENPKFKFAVLNTLNEYQVAPENIILELTESGRVKNFDIVGNVFDFLRSQRLRISFDDFGTGYASLDIFRKLSADELKIDRSFLERITYDVTDQALITTLISLCHSMNMIVCVEGIETKELEELVRQMHPDLLQGYYYNRALTAKEFEQIYFSKQQLMKRSPVSAEDFPERENSMAYSAFRPAQPLCMDAIINNAYAGIFQVGMDREFTFLTCNEGYRRMLGYTTAEIEQKFKNHALGFVHPDDITYVNDEIRRQLGEGDTVTIEFRIVRKDNTPIWILGTGNVYRSSNGSSSLIVVIIDNDKARRKQLARLQKYGIYKKLLNSLPTGIKLVRYDPDFTIDYISPGFLKIIGYTEEDIRTKFDGKYINLIYPEDREAVFNDIMEQLQKSDVVTMHYRTPCKDGSLIWVETVSRLCPPDEDGIQRACSSVVDVSHISSSRPPEMARGLNIANRYESAATLWGEFLFELNLKTNSFSFSDNLTRLFRTEAQCPLEDAMKLVYAEDVPDIKNAFEECRSGEVPKPVDLRMYMPNGTVRWFSMVFSKPDKIGKIPVSVLGKFTDIDKEKRERDNLLRQAKRDPLTGLLNKSATESSIRKLLAERPDAGYAMLMLDVDGFKQINDKLGHFSGDEALRRLADVLRSLFRQNDIVGRVGGDEFMIFINCGENIDNIKNKAQKILEAVRKEMSSGKTKFPPMTVSIGISRCPDNGTQFYDLFRYADSALYRAKELGRDRYCLSSK